MSFARAFSKRRAQRDITPPLSPHASIRLNRSSSVNKRQISAPVELISTTNMISYTAPSLRISTSKESLEASSPPPLTPDLDAGVPTPPSTPPHDLANAQNYFIPLRPSSVKAQVKVEAVVSVVTSPASPNVPLKSLSRNLSVRHGSKNPFGMELAKVSELAEDFGLDLEVEYMEKHGLCKWSAEEYMAEIEDCQTRPLSVSSESWI